MEATEPLPRNIIERRSAKARMEFRVSELERVLIVCADQLEKIAAALGKHRVPMFQTSLVTGDLLRMQASGLRYIAKERGDDDEHPRVPLSAL